MREIFLFSFFFPSSIFQPSSIEASQLGLTLDGSCFELHQQHVHQGTFRSFGFVNITPRPQPEGHEAFGRFKVGGGVGGGGGGEVSSLGKRLRLSPRLASYFKCRTQQGVARDRMWTPPLLRNPRDGERLRRKRNSLHNLMEGCCGRRKRAATAVTKLYGF